MDRPTPRVRVPSRPARDRAARWNEGSGSRSARARRQVGRAMTRLPILLALILGALAGSCGSAWAATVELSEGRGSTFPAKTFVLTLPQQRVLSSDDVVV